MKPFVTFLDEWIKSMMHFSMQHFFDFAKEKEISLKYLRALMPLHHMGSMSVSRSGAIMGVSNAAASQFFDKLYKKGLVERKEDENDRRTKILTLTEKGENLVRECIEFRHNSLINIANSLTTEQQKQIQDSLELISEKFSLYSPIKDPFDME